MTLKCGDCGAAVEADDAFCGRCGRVRPGESQEDLGALPPPQDSVELDSLPPPDGPPVEAAPAAGAAADERGADQPPAPPEEAVAPYMADGSGGGAGSGFDGPVGAGGDAPPLGVPVDRRVLAGVGIAAVVAVGLGAVLLGGGPDAPVIGSSDTVAYGSLGTGRALPEAPAAEPGELWSDEFEPVIDFDIRGDQLLLLTGRIYETDPDIELLALDLATGEERWSVDGGDPDTWHVVGTDDEAVVLASGEYLSDDAELIVLDDQGEEIWAEDFDGYAVEQLPGRRLNLIMADEFEVLDLVTGEVLVGEDGRLVGVAEDAYVFLDDDDLVVIDGAGEELWSDRVADGVSVSVGDGLVYTLESDDDELIAYDLASGEEVWEADLDDDGYYLVAAPGLGVLTVGSGDSEVFDTSGELLWSDRDYPGTLVNRGGTLLYVAAFGDEIEVRDARTGQRIARERLGDEAAAFGADTLAAGALLIGDGEDIVAYGYDDLEELWSVDTDDDAVGRIVIGGGVIVTDYYDFEADESIVAVFR